MVVDDNLTNRRILTDILRRWGMKPAAAASGLEALSLIERAFEAGHPFALIITDVHMPEMDGFELAEKLNQSPYCAEAIVLMLTSRERPGDIERARNAGVSNFLLKPVRREELKAVIVKALGKQRVNRGAAGSSEGIPQSTLSPRFVSTSRILLAEDNLVNQRVVQRLLEKEGHEVVVVGNGLEACRALQDRYFRPGPDGCSNARDGWFRSRQTYSRKREA